MSHKNQKEKQLAILVTIFIIVVGLALFVGLNSKEDTVAFPEGTEINEFTFVPDNFTNGLIFSPVSGNSVNGSVVNEQDFQPLSGQRDPSQEYIDEENSLEEDSESTSVQAYVIDYPDGSQAINASYESDLSISELAGLYREAFLNRSWIIDIDESSAQNGFILARQDEESITITLAAAPNNIHTAVTILYKK